MRNPEPADVGKAKSSCGCGPGECAPTGLDRREFLGAGAAAMFAALAQGGGKHAHPVPAEKGLPSGWLAEARRPGARGPRRGAELAKLAFPIGGIGTGFVALAGDGALVEWQIFNNVNKRALVPGSGFWLRWREEGGEARLVPLRQARAGAAGGRDAAGASGGSVGFAEAEFDGRYPVGTLRLRDPNIPVEVEIDAWSPLVPLDAEGSAVPAAVFEIRLRASGARPVEATVFGSLTNAVGYDGQGVIAPEPAPPAFPEFRGNRGRVVAENRWSAALLDARPFERARLARPMRILVIGAAPRFDARDVPETLELAVAPRLGVPDLAPYDAIFATALADPLEEADVARLLAWVRAGGVLVASEAEGGWASAARAALAGAPPSRTVTLGAFEDAKYTSWEAEGAAFGNGPVAGPVSWQNPVSGWTGRTFVNSFQPDDAPKGSLTSAEFTLDRDFVHLRVGGGALPGTRVELRVDGSAVLAARGRNTEELLAVHWDVRRWRGRRARIRAVDEESGGWGHVLLDDVRLSDDAEGKVAFSRAAADRWDRALREAPPEPASLPWFFEGASVRRVGKGRIALAPAGAFDGPGLLATAAFFCEIEATPSTGRREDDPFAGSMAIGVAGAGGRAAVLPADGPIEACLAALVADGRLPEAPSAAAAPGRTVRGLVAETLRLAPGARGSTRMTIGWHFPNRQLGSARVGNHYAKRFRDAERAARAASPAPAPDPGADATRAFAECLYGSTLPWPILDAAGSQLSIARSPTLMRLADGHVAGYEGLNATSGCCPMNCAHVYNYAQAMARIFPELERDLRRLDFFHQQTDEGGVHNRIAVPIPEDPSGEPPFADGHLGAILKAYREHLNSPDDALLRELWPNTKKAIEWAIRELDRDDDGVLEGAQWNTYDQIVTGPNTFVGTLYLAALRACEEMAKRRGEAEAAARYRAIFERGAARYVKVCFNGEYFEQKEGHEYGAGCLADQLLGEWWARILGLGRLLPEAAVKSALRAIYRHNFLPDFTHFRHDQRVFADGKDRGLLNCTWPRGGRPGTEGYPGKPILYCDEVWTGVEYAVAALMLWEGMEEEALAIVRGARDRYDGTKRNPFNEIECGDQYARAMSSWSLLLASQGTFLDGPAGVLRIDPNLARDDHASLFTGPRGFGLVRAGRNPWTSWVSVEIRRGELALRELRAPRRGANGVEVRWRPAEGAPEAGPSLPGADASRLEGAECVVAFPNGATIAGHGFAELRVEAPVVSWRVAARAAWIGTGTIRADPNELRLARAKRGEHVTVSLEPESEPGGAAMPTIRFRHFAAPAGSLLYRRDPSLEELAALDGARRLAFLTMVEGQLWLADDEGMALLEPTEATLAASRALLDTHARWLREPLPGGADAEALAREIGDALARGPEEQDAKILEMAGWGRDRVPALVRALDDRRPIARPRIALANRSPGAPEAHRQYSPKLVSDAVAAILNHVTGESFGFVYSGASEEERDLCARGWRLYLRHTPALGAEVSNLAPK